MAPWKNPGGEVDGLPADDSSVGELHSCEGLFRSLAENLSYGVVAIDRNHRVLWLNSAMAELFDKPAEKIVGRDCFREFEKRDGICPHCPGVAAMAVGEPCVVESEGIRDDGTVFCDRLRAFPTFAADGTPDGFIELVEEISERKLAGQRLERLILLQESLLQSGTLQEKVKRITDGVVDILDADFARIWLTRAGDRCELDCVHATVTEGPHVCRRRDRCLHLVASSGRYTHTDGRMHRRVPFGCYKIGRVAAAEEPGFITNEVSVDPGVYDHAWAREIGLVSFAGYKLQRETGEPIGVLTMFCQQEIQRDERALFESIAGIASQVILTASTKEDVERKERYYRSLLNSMHEDIVVIDRDYVVCDLNGDGLVTIDAKRSDVIGRHCHEAIYGESDPCTWRGERCVLPVVFETGEPHSCRRTFARVDRGVVHVDIQLSPQRDETGAVIHVIEAIRDMTQLVEAQEAQRRSEARLRQWQKLEAIGQLAGGVAHDFNNIMTAIIGHAEMSIYDLRAELGPGHSVVHSVEEIELAARQASELTRQLLAVGRRSMIRPEVLNLNRILLDLNGMLRRLVTENITLAISTHPQLLRVRADAGQIEQVVLNMVGNAVDAMPNGGRLSLETQNVVLGDKQVPEVGGAEPGPHVMLAVSDTGVGMDEATRERIFEPFFTTKEMDRGTGLGLATVLGIVQQAGGHIQVYSEPGCGTTFKIYFPALEESRDPVIDPQAHGAQLTGSETLLLCEDDRAVRDLTARLLESAGYSVLVAASGREALELAADDSTTFDLLITDVIMTDINGRQVSDALTEQRPGLRTLYISGYTSDVIAQHGVLDDGVQFLQKPFSRKSLLARVREVLQLGRGASKLPDG